MDAGRVISDWNKLGALVKDVRKGRGWSQSHLADRAHVSRAWIAKLEGGHRGAELEQILRLLTALNLSLIVQPTGPAPDLNPRGVRQGAGAEPRMDDARIEASRRRRIAWANARALGVEGVSE